MRSLLCCHGLLLLLLLSLFLLDFSILLGTRGNRLTEQSLSAESISESLTSSVLCSNQPKARTLPQRAGGLWTLPAGSYLGETFAGRNVLTHALLSLHFTSRSPHCIGEEVKLKHSPCSNGSKEFPYMGPTPASLQCLLFGP